MKFLVTGGAGFIGSNFVRYLLGEKKGAEVRVLDALTYAGNLESLKDVRNKIEFVKGDIRKKEDAEKAVAGCDVVVHFAAESHVDRSISDASPFLTTNINGTVVMLEAALKHNVKKVIHISTDEVYGSVEKGKSRENDVFLPNSPYSASKASAEHMARAYHVTYGLPVVITRSSNNYGPYQHPEKLIARFITDLLRGKKVPVYGAGKNVRDWLYVLDNCEGISLVAEKGKPGEAYNIGGCCEKTNLEVTNSLLKLLGKGEEMIQHVEDRKGHDLRYALDISKMKKLGWTPRTSFDEGLRETVGWFKKNEWWWKPLIKD